MKKFIPAFLFFSVLIWGMNAFSQSPEAKKAMVKNILHEMFVEEEKKYPALKAHLNDESKKTFQEAYGIMNAKPPQQAINYIRGSKQWYISNTGIAEIISAPRITSIVPADKIEANNMLTIFGNNLQGAREVTFNGVKGSISVSESGIIRVIVPNMEGQTRVYAVTPTGTAKWDYCNIFKPKPLPVISPPQPPKPEPITKNALGNPELCFGAVGKACGGFGDLKDDETKATRPGTLTAGCSEEVNGVRRCWVVPGSIKHDNCCVQHPHGKQCGGPMSDGSNAGESNHDGNCVQEWDDAFWDVKNGRGWEVDFPAKQPGDLTPAASPQGRYSGGERVGTVNLCAPDDASISARHHAAFCCSGNVKKYWALGVEDWYICQPKSNRSVQQIGGKVEGTPSKMDMSKAPSKPGQPKTQPIVAEQKPKAFPLTVEQERKIAKATLLSVFETERARYPALNEFLQDENKKPFQQALADLRAEHHVELFKQTAPAGRRQALTSWINQEKTNYVKNTGIAEMMKTKMFKLAIEKPYSGKIISEDKQVDCGISKCVVEYKDGEKVALKAVPDSANTRMTGWFGDCSGKDLQCTLTMDNNKKVGAGFFYETPKPKPQPIATPRLLTIEKPYSGKITSEDKKIDCGIKLCTAEYKDGEKVALKAVPDSANTRMTGWFGDCSGKDLQCTLTMDNNKKVGAGFFYEKGQAIKPSDMKFEGGMVPPPPPSQVTQKKPEKAEEPEIAVRQEAAPEETRPNCERGTWSPTLRTCIEDQVQEEAPPPDCGAGAHWSPTLKSCQGN